MELAARLRAFAGFVRRGSFSGAAQELRISQPAVSKHIADIERELGVKLIERHSRALTAAGEFLASHVLRADARCCGKPRTAWPHCENRCRARSQSSPPARPEPMSCLR